jgi:hypothetical protein
MRGVLYTLILLVQFTRYTVRFALGVFIIDHGLRIYRRHIVPACLTGKMDTGSIQ